MCLAVYLASSNELPHSDGNKPRFYLKETKDNEKVRKQLSLPYVYYAGSHEGCGCGFLKDVLTTEELSECQKNYTDFAAILRLALQQGMSMEIFTCWEGDQKRLPKTTRDITPDELEASSFQLQELELLKVR